MKKTVCAVMAIVMLVTCFSLFSCGKKKVAIEPPKGGETEPRKNFDPGPVRGSWTASVSAVDFLFPGDEWDTGSQTWNDSEIKLSLQFTEGGTVVFGLSKTETRAFTANNLEAINALFGYTLEEVKEEGNYETDEDVVEALLDTFASLNKTGKYTYEDGIITTELISTAHTHGEDEEETPARIKVTVTADRLTFTEYAVESEEHGLFSKDVLPITFDRYN